MIKEENIGIIIQARTGSKRLPEKMIKPFYHNKSILELLLGRILEHLEPKIPVIVATTNQPNDDLIEKISLASGVNVFRGDENNVLKRFIDAADKFKLNRVIRICADNPFLDIEALNQLITEFRNKDVDYFSYSTRDGVPSIKTHFGFWTEGVKLSALRKTASLTGEKIFLEHVTNYLYQENSGFDICLQKIDSAFDNKSIRLTIDTQVDFEMAQNIYAFLMDKYEGIPVSKTILEEVCKNEGWLNKMKQEIINNTK